MGLVIMLPRYAHWMKKICGESAMDCRDEWESVMEIAIIYDGYASTPRTFLKQCMLFIPLPNPTLVWLGDNFDDFTRSFSPNELCAESTDYSRRSHPLLSNHLKLFTYHTDWFRRSRRFIPIHDFRLAIIPNVGQMMWQMGLYNTFSSHLRL